MKKNIVSIVLSTVIFFVFTQGMDNKKAVKEKSGHEMRLEHDLQMWSLYVECRAPLYKHPRYYFNTQGEFIGSVCSAEEKEAIDRQWEEWHKKNREFWEKRPY